MTFFTIYNSDKLLLHSWILLLHLHVHMYLFSDINGLIWMHAAVVGDSFLARDIMHMF